MRLIYTRIMSCSVIKIGNIPCRVEIEPTSLAFRTNVLTITPPRLLDVTTLAMPIG